MDTQTLLWHLVLSAVPAPVEIVKPHRTQAVVHSYTCTEQLER